VAVDNADLQDHDPYQVDHRRAYHGRGLTILRATQVGLLRIAATADGLKDVSATVVVRKGSAAAVVPPAR